MITNHPCLKDLPASQTEAISGGFEALFGTAHYTCEYGHNENRGWHTNWQQKGTDVLQKFSCDRLN